MKTLVEALRRNAESFDAPRRDLADAENSAFRCKFASAFGPRPAGTPQNGENPPQDKPEQGKRKTAHGKSGKR